MRACSYLRPVKACRTVFGSVMSCDAGDFVQRMIRFFNIFEHNLTYYTIAHLNEGDVYLDIGANVGYYSLLASKLVGPKGRVISVEADPKTFAALNKNLELNECRNVVALNVAATGTRCRVDIARNDPRNTSSNEIVSNLKDGDAGSIEGLPFPELAGKDMVQLRFIKIDIEGSEAPVLGSILESLPMLKPDLIVASEVSPKSAKYVEQFAAAGFRTYALHNVYTTDYYLIRSYLRRFGEDTKVHMIPVETYSAQHRDYIFERRA